MARWPKYVPTPETRRQVMTMAGFGIPTDEIAKLLNVSGRTIRNHYRRELDTGATEANMRVAQALYLNATRHNSTAAQIFWMKARMGWKETQSIEQSGPDGGPLNFVVMTPKPVDDAEEWLRLYGPNGADEEAVIDGDVIDN